MSASEEEGWIWYIVFSIYQVVILVFLFLIGFLAYIIKVNPPQKDETSKISGSESPQTNRLLSAIPEENEQSTRSLCGLLNPSQRLESFPELNSFEPDFTVEHRDSKDWAGLEFTAIKRVREQENSHSHSSPQLKSLARGAPQFDRDAPQCDHDTPSSPFSSSPPLQSHEKQYSDLQKFTAKNIITAALNKKAPDAPTSPWI